MNHPESPHQAAIAGAFSKKVRPELCPAAAELVKVYDSTYGSASPGCCPEALAAVLDHIEDKGDWGELKMLATMLRGWQP